jgi:hypothetical protein
MRLQKRRDFLRWTICTFPHSSHTDGFAQASPVRIVSCICARALSFSRSLARLLARSLSIPSPSLPHARTHSLLEEETREREKEREVY